MEKSLATPEARKINPVQDPQILPLSYCMPLVTTRFSSPAASACVPQSFLELFFRKK
ncbi:MAG: hypothetical protein JWM58_4126 [Rhizobium sp.]|nr:hypothetical protein [Rhizobium sp.]